MTLRAPGTGKQPWLLPALLGLVLPVLLTWGLVHIEHRDRHKRQEETALAESDSLVQNLARRMVRVRRLAVEVAADPRVARALQDPSPDSLAEASHHLQLLARAGDSTLDQVRLGDATGQVLIWWGYDERIGEFRDRRVDAPTMKGRDFFEAALAQPRGGSWIGATELFRAPQQLAPGEPVEPYLRVSVPVFGDGERPLGALVLNIHFEPTAFVGQSTGGPWLAVSERGDFVFRSAQAEPVMIPMAPDGRKLMPFRERFGFPATELGPGPGFRTVHEGVLVFRTFPLDSDRAWYLLKLLPDTPFGALAAPTALALSALWGLCLTAAIALWRVQERRSHLAERETQAVLLSRVVDAVTDVAIVVTEPDGRIRLFNRGAERLLGYRAEEVIGLMTPKAFHDPAELEARRQAMEAAQGRPLGTREIFAPPEATGAYTIPREGHAAEPQRWSYLRKDGSRVPVALSVSVLEDSRGAVIGQLSVAQDLSLQQTREEHLEAAVREAQDAARMKSSFLATMSHEVRTPMNAIMAMVRYLLSTPLEPEQREITEIGQKAAANLLRMLDGVLDLSKAEAGMLELESITFSPAVLTRECAELWRAEAGSKGLGFQMDLPEVSASVQGDPVRIQQVLNNLLGNALKFTDAGRVSLLLVAEDLGEELALRWDVSDTGPGISPEAIQGIFEPFRQADSSITRQYGGTGLGLALCRELAERMGGSLEAHSRPGQGSTFVFQVRLPKAD